MERERKKGVWGKIELEGLKRGWDEEQSSKISEKGIGIER